MRLRFHPAALVDLDDAVAYLEDKHSGLGAHLFDEVTKRIAQAACLGAALRSQASPSTMMFGNSLSSASTTSS